MNIKTLVIAALLAIGVAACVPDYGLTTEDYRTVVTVYDTAQDYNALGTYFLVDSVFHIFMPGDSDNITREYDRRIIDAYAGQMATRGWRRITDTTNGNIPNALMRVSVTRALHAGYYYDYWGGYWGGWYGGWWGYPGYYPPAYVNTYNYSTGSLISELDAVIPPATPSDSARLRAVWLGSSNGLLSSSQGTNVAIITTAITQMFNQSPYLVLTNQQ